jgi:hypothetical protein
MKRILIFLCLFYVMTTTSAMATNYQDWWWNPGLSGMGVNIGHEGNTIVAAWYLYDRLPETLLAVACIERLARYPDPDMTRIW